MTTTSNGEASGEAPPQPMDPWLEQKLEWLESERERQDFRMQEMLDRLEAFATDKGKVERKQEQMSRKHEESFEQSEGQVRKLTERLYDLEKKVHENEKRNEDAIRVAGLEFNKRYQESDHDRRSLQATMTTVNTNFQNLSVDVAARSKDVAALDANQQNDKAALQQKFAMMEQAQQNDKAALQQKFAMMEQALRADLGSFGAQMQQLRVDLGGLGARSEQQAIQSRELFAVQKQQVLALDVAVQALRTTAVTSATHQTKAEASESMKTQPLLHSGCVPGAVSSMSWAPVATGGLQQSQPVAPQALHQQQHQQQKPAAKQNEPQQTAPGGAHAFATQQSPVTASLCCMQTTLMWSSSHTPSPAPLTPRSHTPSSAPLTPRLIQ